MFNPPLWMKMRIHYGQHEIQRQNLERQRANLRMQGQQYLPPRPTYTYAPRPLTPEQKQKEQASAGTGLLAFGVAFSAIAVWMMATVGGGPGSAMLIFGLIWIVGGIAVRSGARKKG